MKVLSMKHALSVLILLMSSVTFVCGYNNDANTYMNQGSDKHTAKDYDGAIADYTQAIMIDPGNADYYYARAGVKKDKGDDDGAIADYTRTIELNPQSIYAYYCRGDERMSKGDYAGAIADWEKAIALVPSWKEKLQPKIDAAQAKLMQKTAAPADNAQAVDYFNQGDAEFRNGDYDGAIADYTRAIGINPQYVNAYCNRAQAKYDKKDYDGAIVDATRAIELDPNLDPSKGDACYFRGKAEDAKGDLNDVTDVLGAGYAKKDYNDAIADWEKAIALIPFLKLTYQYLIDKTHAKLDFINGDYEKAIASWEQAIQRDATVKEDLQPWIDKAQAKLKKT